MRAKPADLDCVTPRRALPAEIVNKKGSQHLPGRENTIQGTKSPQPFLCWLVGWLVFVCCRLVGFCLLSFGGCLVLVGYLEGVAAAMFAVVWCMFGVGWLVRGLGSKDYMQLDAHLPSTIIEDIRKPSAICANCPGLHSFRQLSQTRHLPI